MSKENLFSDDDRHYLQMLQSNIDRMASNSANCKTWLVTIIAALLAIGCGIEELNGWILLATVPIVVFWYLDTLYLNLERGMRNRELDFLLKARGNDDDYVQSLYDFSPLEVSKNESEKLANGFKATDAYFSKSVVPLYMALLVVVVFFTIILNWDMFL